MPVENKTPPLRLCLSDSREAYYQQVRIERTRINAEIAKRDREQAARGDEATGAD